MDLNIIWFFLIGILLIGYAILDGFDLGVGILQIFAKNEEDRMSMVNSIKPFWDGNEVWLLTAGGAIFAAFPHVYATVFSGFYLAMMLLLVGLIFRALSIELRNQLENARWKKFWDAALAVSSVLTALLLGVALGNIFTGIPIDASKNYTGSFFTLLRPLPLIIGLTGLSMFILQGASYLLLKTEGALWSVVKGWTLQSWKIFFVFMAVSGSYTAMIYPEKIVIFFQSAWPVVILPVLLYGVIYLPAALAKNNGLRTFIASSLIIFSMIGIVGGTIYPNMVPALNPANSLTIYNSSSSQKTLTVMLWIALSGMPIVLMYTAYIYRIFRKTKSV